MGSPSCCRPCSAPCWSTTPMFWPTPPPSLDWAWACLRLLARSRYFCVSRSERWTGAANETHRRQERAGTRRNAAQPACARVAMDARDRVTPLVTRALSPIKDMPEIKRTEAFERWLKRLRDQRGRAAILARLDRLLEGNRGDVRWIGEGVSEMRIGVGPGYRVYYTQLGDTYVMLLAGDKRSQRRDIAKAKALASELKEE